MIAFPFLVFAIFIIIAVTVAVFSSKAARKRTEALRQLARSLGLDFHDGHDASFDERFPFLDKLCQGSKRYAFNVMSGQYKSNLVTLFDYHYETYSTDSKGNRQTAHHYFSFVILNHSKMFPELIISREGWFSKVIQFFGYDDIDFESAEFSRMFQVRSPDRKFAYDICHSKMIEFLLANRDLNIEIERNCVTLFFQNRLEPAEIPRNLDRLVAIRRMFPDYLM
jgi:hypothetical protein